MVKKVVFVLSLFLLVDRVMYYKLGQGFHQERQASLSSSCITPYHDQQEALRKKRILKRMALYTKHFLEESKLAIIS